MTKASDAVMEKAKYSIKGLKTMEGHDGLVIRCNLYYENKKIAECYDDGNGGMLEVSFVRYNQKTKRMEDIADCGGLRFSKFVDEYPEEPVDISEDWMKKTYPTGFKKLDEEDMVNSFITTELRSRDLKKALKKKILFINKKCEMRELSFKGNPTITPKHIEVYKEKWAKDDEMAFILNEMPFEEALNVYEAHSE